MAPAKFGLGELYAEGRGVEKDASKALELFKSAAKMGHVQAQHNLAQMNKFGEGTEHDPTKAFNWEKRAAENGFAMSAHALAGMYEEGIGTAVDLVESVKWYEIAAEAGYPYAADHLGHLYEVGEGGCPVDFEKALYYNNLAIELGEFAAYYKMAAIYASGRLGLPKNRTKADQLYRLSEEKDHDYTNKISAEHELPDD